VPKMPSPCAGRKIDPVQPRMAMKPTKSHYIWIAAAAAGLSTFGAHGGEAAFPTKPVTIIMPYAAGGSSDIITRSLAKSLTEIWGRNAIVENRPGASGMIG